MSAPTTVARRRRPRAFQRIAVKIREDVFAGRRKPGDRLPNEAAIAESFGVSRPAVREALRVLELEGVVRVEHGFRGGAFVASGGTQHVSRALETMLRLERLDRSELYTARRHLEPVVARLAAAAVDDETREALWQNVAEAERRVAAGRPAFPTNAEFHALVARGCGNRILTLMTDALLELLRTVETRTPSDVAANREACAAHRAIATALTERDADGAEREMAGHLAWLQEHFGAAPVAAGGDRT